MPHTEVTEIEITDGNDIRVTVEVFGFEAGTIVEISGHATQANGAIATFYVVESLPDPGSDGGSLLTVIAVPAGAFAEPEVITVAGQVRVANVWGTVLDEDPNEHRPGIKAVWKAKARDLVTPMASPPRTPTCLLWRSGNPVIVRPQTDDLRLNTCITGQSVRPMSLQRAIHRTHKIGRDL
jgi:hypothetical protein